MNPPYCKKITADQQGWRLDSSAPMDDCFSPLQILWGVDVKER
jgi:hypothetical protein